MKKITLVCTLLILFFILLVSCSQFSADRHVTVVIPEHPWEKYSDARLWYYLKWGSCSDDIRTVFIDSDTREISVPYQGDKTIFFCAYPLGEMQCFGNAITPAQHPDFLYLDQNSGFLCDLLLNTEGPSASTVNFPKAVEQAETVTEDFRLLDASSFITDVLNGKLGKSSFKVYVPATPQPFACPSGTWISESVFDSRMVVSNNMTEELQLPNGISRFYNPQQNLELRVVVEDSEVFHHVRTSLVPL